ncbi:GntR family transcriptional regulator [Bradyrhizobium sp. CSA207]|uniref:GntR family transcriptional regulator n=1 Tax=Bradyrhizobium sp. CSA207 TaxID=2698826 RepID=UPI0023AE7FE6|nr:GntR family transcriptional regulator [Bradyrhizobium sp. CSA207]MDE5444333.1 GntR family transcriptional regulator [Bradyrhizobium sp. CSA207]
MSHLFSDKVSLTFQLSQLLRNRIKQGVYPPGARLPPEVRLAGDLGVSVITVQRALKDLEGDGLITRTRGRGTFVSEQSAASAAHVDRDVLAFMFRDEFDPGTEIQTWALVDRPAGLPGFDSSIKTLKLLRRRVYYGGKPWSFGSIYILPDVAKAMKKSDIKRFPMFRLMREQLGLELKDVDLSFFAEVPSPEVSHALDIDPVAPVMAFRGVLRDVEDRVLTVLEIYYRAELFAVKINLDLRNPTVAV